MSDLFIEHDDGPPGAARVVLVHGAADSRKSFARLRQAFAGRYEVDAYDRRGYQRSRHAAAVPADLSRHLDDLVEILDGREAIVVGHSLGGLLALGSGVRRPDLVRAVVAYEPPAGWLGWWFEPVEGNAPAIPRPGEEPGDFTRRFLETMLGPTRSALLGERALELRALDGPALVADIADLSRRAPFEVRDLQVRVVIGRGSASTARHRRAASFFAGRIGGARLVEIAGAAHDAHLSHPLELAGLVADVEAATAPLG